MMQTMLRHMSPEAARRLDSNGRLTNSLSVAGMADSYREVQLEDDIYDSGNVVATKSF